MISDILITGKTIHSLEVFPPKKTDDIELVYHAIDKMKGLNPDFISVTYGAGGSNSKETLAISSYIKNKCGIEALSHLTCAALTSEHLAEYTAAMREYGLTNILALRGDKPRDMNDREFNSRYFKYASDLISAIDDDFFVAGACYPEKHPDSTTIYEDIENLKKKIDAGAHMLNSQLFFDNQKFYRFLDLCDKAGIDIPILAGIMPITTLRQVVTMVDMSNASIPAELVLRIDKYRDKPEDLKKAGIEFAIMQKLDLLSHGVRGIHLYAMNKPDIAKEFFDAC